MARRPMIFTRVDHDVLRNAQRIADAKFEGNLSFLMRDALRLYMGLYEQSGPRFELEVARLLDGAEQTEGQAA